MNTPAHILLGVAVCGRKTAPGTGWFAAIGAVTPDLSLYVLAGVSLFVLQIPPYRVFGELYYSSEWQSIFAVDNSFFVWGGCLLAALALRSPGFIAFAGAGLLHLIADFPLHNDDARAHFWPVSDWVFFSPVSYWDSQHNAALFAPIGVLIVLASAAVIWRRWPRWSIRGAVVCVCLLEIWVVRQWLLFF